MNNLTVFEYEKLGFGKGEKLTEKQFLELKSLIIPSASEDENIADPAAFTHDASACMSLCSDSGREVIKVKNYVGVIALGSGLVIEVLPKIGSLAPHDEADSSRRLVVEMLRLCRDLPYKAFQRARLGTAKTTLYEVFIRLFLDELAALYKRGLRAGYVTQEDNENFLKGKIMFGEHLRRNYIHKEKFYVQYDSFCFDRAENRLIKSALVYLKDKSRSEENRRDIRRMLLSFDEIRQSENIEGDFAKCETGKGGAEYADVLALVRIFLHKKSFTAYSGKSGATALLFPMEKLFESYVYEKLRPEAEKSGYSCSRQDREKYLFESGGGKFLLRPDIVLRAQSGEKIILDTKWKRLSPDRNINYGISQADMYQMYAYHTRYDGVKKVVLLYPHFGELDGLAVSDYTTSAGGKSVTVQVRTVDLYRSADGGQKLLDCIKPQGDPIA